VEVSGLVVTAETCGHDVSVFLRWICTAGGV
jgi:hypothetical protein